MPVFKDRTEVLYAKLVSLQLSQVLQVNLGKMLSKKCLWDQKKVRVDIQNMPADTPQFLAVRRKIKG